MKPTIRHISGLIASLALLTTTTQAQYLFQQVGGQYFTTSGVQSNYAHHGHTNWAPILSSRGPIILDQVTLTTITNLVTFRALKTIAKFTVVTTNLVAATNIVVAGPYTNSAWYNKHAVYYHPSNQTFIRGVIKSFNTNSPLRPSTCLSFQTNATQNIIDTFAGTPPASGDTVFILDKQYQTVFATNMVDRVGGTIGAITGYEWNIGVPLGIEDAENLIVLELCDGYSVAITRYLTNLIESAKGRYIGF